VPYWPGNLRVQDIQIDYNELIECLRHQTDLRRVSERKGTIAFLHMAVDSPEQKGTASDSEPFDSSSSEFFKTKIQVQVWQLAPLSATLLRLCDGKRTIAEIIREFCELETASGEVSPEKVCLFGLMQLQKGGFIGISSCPVVAEAASDSDSDELATAVVSWRSPASQTGNTQQPWPA